MSYILRVDLANATPPAELTGATVTDVPFAQHPTDLRCDRCGIALCDHLWQVTLAGGVVDCGVAS